MTIQRKAKTAAADAFIAGAPDAGKTRADHSPAPEAAKKVPGIAKGHKRQISLTIAPDLLLKVDQVAKRTGQGRAAIINMAIYRALEGDVFQP